MSTKRTLDKAIKVMDARTTGKAIRAIDAEQTEYVASASIRGTTMKFTAGTYYAAKGLLEDYINKNNIPASSVKNAKVGSKYSDGKMHYQKLNIY